MLKDLLKDTQNSYSSKSMEKLLQAALTRNEQANFQPTLNKVAREASIPIFVTVCTKKHTAAFIIIIIIIHEYLYRIGTSV